MTDEEKKLRLELGLAEVRIKQLQEQLTACEAALAERDSQIEKLDGYAKTNAVEVSRKLVWGAVHNAGRAITNGRIPRWAAVKSALGVGSTTARQLCRVHKAEPDEQVGRGDQCGGCKRIDSYLEVCGGCVCAPTGPDWSHCIRHDEDMGGKTCGCNPKK